MFHLLVLCLLLLTACEPRGGTLRISGLSTLTPSAGGELVVYGSGFAGLELPTVSIGDRAVPHELIRSWSSNRIDLRVPAGVVGGLVAVAWRDMPLADMAAGIGRMRLGAVIFLLAATTAGQFVGPGSSAYPFVHWDMYTAGASQVSYGEVWLVDEAEERRRLLLAGSDVTTEPRALSGRLLQEAEAAAAGDDTAIRVLRESIRVLADGAGSAGRAEVLRCVVDEPTAAQPSRCDVVATVALGEP